MHKQNLNTSTTPTRIQIIRMPLLDSKGIRLFVKRDDEIHPEIAGNKWRKLKYNLQAARRQQLQTLVTFGGAFSNHIAATAAAGKVFGFRTIGILRGERVEPLNPTLKLAQDYGMQFHFVDRSTYRTADRLALAKLLCKEKFYFIPEGGTNALALKGCSEIVKEVQNQFDEQPDYYALACGTGGTIGGLIQGLKGKAQVLGFSALKGDFLIKEVTNLLDKQYSNWSINTDYHFGGYAKFKPALIDFINDFKATQDIPLEPIYTGKMLYGILDLVEQDYFPKGTTILAIHTGGLQGLRGFNQRFGDLLY